MAKKGLRFAGIAAVLAAVVLMSGCALRLVVFDETIPEEETTVVSWGLHVKEFNGIPVDWGTLPSLFKKTDGVASRIPAGDAVLVADASKTDRDAVGHGTTYKINDARFRFHFEPQKKYMLFFVVIRGQWGVNIYDLTEMKGITLSAKYLVAFVPFENVEQGK